MSTVSSILVLHYDAHLIRFALMSKTYIPDTESITNSKSKPEIAIALEICDQIRQKTHDSKSSKRDSTSAR